LCFYRGDLWAGYDNEIHPTQTKLVESTLGMHERDFYIDCLRSVMIALVVLHHTALTYGASGLWFYHELRPSATPSSVILTLFTATNQAYFMGLLFLLAGYFTPASLERKGYARFLSDRFLRLGLPLLAFGLILGSLTVAMVTAAEGKGFWSTFAWLWNHRQFINGPLWFVQALLMFSLAYGARRAWFGAPLTSAQRVPRPVPSYGWWLLSAVGVGAAALVIRQVVPTRVNLIGMQLGYFASYVFLFCLGIAAWRYNWLRQLKWEHARPWIIDTLPVAWLSFAALLPLAISLNAPGKSSYSGGLSWTTICYAFWEPFVAWGPDRLMAARLPPVPEPALRHLDMVESPILRGLHHPPGRAVGISLLLRGWAAPALVKFAVIGSLVCATCWILADPLVRSPGLRRIV
jgi:fucose 4-O-acetylase-like acetyltransferase